MKQNIFITALLAAMLVIAGCGGGGGSNPDSDQTQTTGNTKTSSTKDKDKENNTGVIIPPIVLQAKTTQENLNNARMALDGALTAAQTAVTANTDLTLAQIQAILTAHTKLQEEYGDGMDSNFADDVVDADKTAADTLLMGYVARFQPILAAAAMDLEDALAAHESGGPTPTNNQIAEIRRLYMVLTEAVKAEGVDKTAANNLLTRYMGRLTAISPTTPVNPTGTTQTALDEAVRELQAAVTAGDIPAPTQALINAIVRERTELETAITNAADEEVVTTEADALIVSSGITLTAIRARFAAPPDPADPPARSTGNLANVEITRDASDSDNIVWKITIPGFNNAVHELPDADLSASHSWNSITSDDTRTGGSAGDVYAIAVYGKSRDNNGTPEFDDVDRMGFGAWVNNGSIEVGNTDHVPVLIDGAAATNSTDPTGKEYLKARIATAGSATYGGEVAAIVESDLDGQGPYDAGYFPQIGEVSLTANFGSTTTISGHVDIQGDRIALSSGDMDSTNYTVSGQTELTDDRTDLSRFGTGNWDAGFVHEGKWIVGKFDLEINASDKNSATGDINYRQYKGAFGAVEQPGS